VIDPLLARPNVSGSAVASLRAAGVLDAVHLIAGSSSRAVEGLAERTGRRWDLIFIDGDHEGDPPRADAAACETFATEDCATPRRAPVALRGHEFPVDYVAE
jgi:hypothetical protein